MSIQNAADDHVLASAVYILYTTRYATIRWKSLTWTQNLSLISLILI